MVNKNFKVMQLFNIYKRDTESFSFLKIESSNATGTCMYLFSSKKGTAVQGRAFDEMMGQSAI